MTQSRNAAVAPIKRRALRINDAAAAYGVGRSTIYKLMQEGKLATVKVAGRRLVHATIWKRFCARDPNPRRAGRRGTEKHIFQDQSAPWQ